MKVIILTLCLIGAVFANPILHNVLVSSEVNSNSTETVSLSVSRSSENTTSELQSSEESASNQNLKSESSESSESTESTSEDKTSEESESQSDEADGMDSRAETRDNSMGSEENVRKRNWVRVFASTVKVLSAENHKSEEVKGQPEHHEVTGRLPAGTSAGARTLVDDTTDSSDTTSDSTDSSDSSDVTAAPGDGSESSSSESQETGDSSKSTEDSDGSDSSDSSDVSDSSDSTELGRLKDCVNATQSCESDERFAQGVGDDAHFSVDYLMVPEEDNMELRLRR